MRTTFHYPESPYGRTYADVITKISRMDSLPWIILVMVLRYKFLNLQNCGSCSVIMKCIKLNSSGDQDTNYGKKTNILQNTLE